MKKNKLFPTKSQWKRWSLPSKIGVIGSYVGVLSLFIALITIWFTDQKPDNNYYVSNSYGQILTYELDTISINTSGRNPRLLEMGLSDSEETIEVKAPKVIIRDNTFAEQRLNSKIQEFFEGYNIDLVETDKSFFSGYFISDFEVAYKINNLLGFKLDIYWQQSGAARAHHVLAPLNFNLENGEVFEYKDIFRTTGLETVSDLILKTINQNCGCIWAKSEDLSDLIKYPRSFYLTDYSLVITFPAYVVACGVCGPVTAELRFSDIKEITNPNGPLAFIKKMDIEKSD